MVSFCSCCFVSGVIKGMTKLDDFKISSFNPRGAKILNSTTSGREPVVGREGE